MTSGVQRGRSVNLQAATLEGKRVLRETKDWDRTKEHLKVWLVAHYALSRTTVDDYIHNIRTRLLLDQTTKPLMGHEEL